VYVLRDNADMSFAAPEIVEAAIVVEIVKQHDITVQREIGPPAAAAMENPPPPSKWILVLAWRSRGLLDSCQSIPLFWSKDGSPAS
jgi:hypothetical protein